MLDVMRFGFITEKELPKLILAIDETYAVLQDVLQLDVEGAYQTYGMLYIHFSTLLAHRLQEPFMENYMGESRIAYELFMQDVLYVMKMMHYHFEYVESFRPMCVKRHQSPKGGFTNV